MDAITTVDLTKRYRDTVAVDRLNLSVREGELLSLLGVNGAGKTTTLKMLSGLTEPTSGDAVLMGKSIRKEPAAVKAMLAVSPQENAVAPLLTVRENLEMMCGVYGFAREETAASAAETLTRFGLERFAEKKAGKLSGGWQRRLSIAMALISRPRILFLDEPTLGLDVIARRELWEMIASLKGRVTMILTTHYLEEAEALSDRVAVMRDGRLLMCAPPAEILRKTGARNFEEAFLAVVKGAGAC